MGDSRRNSVLPTVFGAAVSLVVTGSISVASYYLHKQKYLTADWHLAAAIGAVACLGLALVVMMVLVLVPHARATKGLQPFLLHAVELRDSPWLLGVAMFCAYQAASALILALLPMLV